MVFILSLEKLDSISSGPDGALIWPTSVASIGLGEVSLSRGWIYECPTGLSVMEEYIFGIILVWLVSRV